MMQHWIVALAPVLYSLIVLGGFLSGRMLLFEQPRQQKAVNGKAAQRSLPLATISLLVLIAIPSTLQLFFPSILTALERNAALFQRGQLWRIVTPMFVQDGGATGTLFNLLSLLLIGLVAEKLWGGRRLLLLFFCSGILLELLAFYWQPIGAGNSGANFGVAAATALLSFLSSSNIQVRVWIVLVLVCGLLLLAVKDIHGAAVMIGLVLGLLAAKLKRPGL